MAEDDRVELTDLDVITRYSLAVRSATADRAELIATLRSDLAWLEGLRRTRNEPKSPARGPAQSPAKRTAAKKTATKRTPAKRTSRSR